MNTHIPTQTEINAINRVLNKNPMRTNRAPDNKDFQRVDSLLANFPYHTFMYPHGEKICHSLDLI